MIKWHGGTKNLSDAASWSLGGFITEQPPEAFTRNPLDLDELRRIAEQAVALRPDHDRVVMGKPMFEIFKGLSTPSRPTWASGALGGFPYGTPVVIEEGMPDGVIEFRDGDRIVKRIGCSTVADAACCDLHGRNCEQGGDECCYGCTEAHHFEVGHGGVPCSSPDLSAGSP